MNSIKYAVTGVLLFLALAFGACRDKVKTVYADGPQPIDSAYAISITYDKDGNITDTYLNRQLIKEDVRIGGQLYNYQEPQTLSRKDLLGVWGADITGNAAFVMKEDSMFYVEHPVPQHAYAIAGGYLNIYLPDDTFRLQVISLRNDTLVLDHDGIRETFVRR